jgi:hypothetical protein
VVPARSEAEDVSARPDAEREPETDSAAAQPRGYLWAELMKRTFGFDVLACPDCGGRLRLVALIDEGLVSRRILEHLGLPADVPEPRPARAPPIVHLAASAGSAGADHGGEFVYGFDS